MRLKAVGEYVIDEDTVRKHKECEYFTGYDSEGRQVSVKAELSSVTAHVMRSRLGTYVQAGPRLSNLLRAIRCTPE